MSGSSRSLFCYRFRTGGEHWDPWDIKAVPVLSISSSSFNNHLCIIDTHIVHTTPTAFVYNFSFDFLTLSPSACLFSFIYNINTSIYRLLDTTTVNTIPRCFACTTQLSHYWHPNPGLGSREREEGDSRCVVTKTAPAHHFSRWREIRSTLILSHCHTSSSQFPFPKLKVESSDLALTPFARPSPVTCYTKGPPFSLYTSLGSKGSTRSSLLTNVRQRKFEEIHS
jgi:hypothetical protein